MTSSRPGTSSSSSSSSPPRRKARIELHKLSIPERPRGISPKKNRTGGVGIGGGGINLSLDLQRSCSVGSSTNHFSCATDDEFESNEQLFYALASKKRQIGELEQALKMAHKDFAELEKHWKLHAASREPQTSTLQNWHNKLQRSVEEGGILQSLVNKFSELTTRSDDHNEYNSMKTVHDNFYLKSKFDYDDDEEVQEEETGNTLFHGKEKAFCR